MIKSYSELRRIETFKERYEYLKLGGSVGESTFGFDRYLNQQLYRSREWKHCRHFVITRDLGCDLGIEGYEIHDRLYIHHMNPVDIKSIREGSDDLFDPAYLITTSHRTHNAIHYGDESLLPRILTPRSRGDTKLW